MTTIYDREGWTLDSQGRGAFYTLSHIRPDGLSESCFFQGDDADIFREMVMGPDGFLIDEGPLRHVFSEYRDVMMLDEPDALGSRDLDPVIY